MKTPLLIIATLLPLMQEDDETAKAIKIAENLIELFVNDEFEKITPFFDDRLQELINLEKLNEAKQTMNAEVGSFYS